MAWFYDCETRVLGCSATAWRNDVLRRTYATMEILLAVLGEMARSDGSNYLKYPNQRTPIVAANNFWIAPPAGPDASKC